MLKFFREKAKWIGISVIGFFVITMFAGSMYMGRMLIKNPFSNSAQDSIGHIGEIQISGDRYQAFLNQALSRIPQSEWAHLDPEVIEVLQFSALQRALNEALFLKGAQEKDLSVSKTEYKRTLESLMPSYGVKNVGELKKLLKQNNYPYSRFKESIEKDMLAQKFVTELQKTVTVTTQNVYAYYTKTLVQHLLIKSQTASPNAEAFIQNLRKQALSGTPFETLAQSYSQDSKSQTNKGILPWISIGETTPEFEKAAENLPIGQLSTPFRTPYGYHILRVLGRRVELPPTFNFNTAKTEATQYFQTRAIRVYLNSFSLNAPLELTPPSLKAYYAKFKGDIETAKGAYQAQISSNPASPVPHYLLAKLYRETQAPELAKQELEKAKVKADLNASADFIALRLLLAQDAKKAGNSSEFNTQCEKAYTLAQNSKPALTYLEKQFTEIGNPSLAQKAKARLGELK
jgi:parvulin-like peptidyl-prolyl isomerase